jgi:acyl carrier protein
MSCLKGAKGLLLNIESIHEALEAAVKGSSANVTSDSEISKLGIDSLDLYQFLSELEDRTGKPFPDELFADMETIRDIQEHFGA